MKSIFLSVVIICALVIAGLGGTLATWSDSETSAGNYIETGSLDLLVNGTDDLPWGRGVPASINVDCIIPCKLYGPYPVTVWNASQDCMVEYPWPKLYIHVKEMCCANALPKEGSGYPDPFTNAMKPEPELVAEYGGKVNCTWVDGVGILGDDCTLPDYIDVIIEDAAGNVLWKSTLGEMVCNEIYLCDLEPCHEQTLYFWIHLQQPSEEEFDMNYIPNPGEAGHDLMHWTKFNDWPSWALMKDITSFDMEFDLWLEDC